MLRSIIENVTVVDGLDAKILNKPDQVSKLEDTLQKIEVANRETARKREEKQRKREAKK